MANPDGVTRGTLEDVGKSMLICDVCEEMVSKGGRFYDGDPCPECEEREPDEAETETAIIRAANTYRGN